MVGTCGYSHDKGLAGYVWYLLQPSAGTMGLNKKAGQTVSRRKIFPGLLANMQLSDFVSLLKMVVDFLHLLVTYEISHPFFSPL